jgi:hypothetical protein
MGPQRVLHGKQGWAHGRLCQVIEIRFQSWKKISAGEEEGLLSGKVFLLRSGNEGLTVIYAAEKTA